VNLNKKLTRLCLAAALIVCSFITVLAATEHWNDASETAASPAEWTQWKQDWETIQQDYEKIALNVGRTASELNFGWYSHTNEAPVIKLSTSPAMTNAKIFTGAQAKIKEQNGVQYYANKVTVTQLKENTTYYYTYTDNGQESAPAQYRTHSFSAFKMLYVGDPQIGASSGQVSSEGDKLANLIAARNDAYNWNKTLQMAIKNHPDLSFIISVGDQIDDTANGANQEYQYAGFLNPSFLRSLPLATVIGNHDSKFDNYSNHFNNPNSFESADAAYTLGRTAAGTDYYYTYGNALFIVLDTNNYNCQTHENVIQKAIQAHGDKKWRIVLFHQDIYGSGYDHSDSDGIVLRTQLTPLFDKYKIDVALQGHDHTYSRTYQLTGDGAAHPSFDASPVKATSTDAEKAPFLAANNAYSVVSAQIGGTVVNPKGTVYLEANSSTGSKFYNLIPVQQNYIAERSQTWTPTYAVISLDNDTFSVTTYDAATGQILEGSTPYTIKKTAVAK
jgi:hypothetical protein